MELDLPAPLPWDQACRALLRRGPGSVLLDGRGGFSEGWAHGPLLTWGLDPLVAWGRQGLDRALGVVSHTVAARRADGGSPGTGVILILPYEAGTFGRRRTRGPTLSAFVVDRSVRLLEDGRWRLTLAEGERQEAGRERDRLVALGPVPPARSALHATTAPRSSLPREAYLASVERLRADIARGDIYQANLCQRLEVGSAGDPLELYLTLAGRAPAPHSAFARFGERALVSVSPETFLRSRTPGTVETWPIKGTRPRGSTDDDDAAQARELMHSSKDRAELVMIVDLERNDLGRLCVPGSVDVDPLVALRSYASVHHLVSRVRGRLRPRVALRELLEATFPGGSITGAPKRRAIEILEQVEPVERGFFTGSLFFFADDGTFDSSILIRTLDVSLGHTTIGAGGGIVTDSDPDQEWLESNHKARALAHALGFDPREAM